MQTEGASAYQIDDNCRVLSALLAPHSDALADGLAEAVVAALPYRIAVLDRAGTIVGVNNLWRRAAHEHGAKHLAESSIGQHYRQAWLSVGGPSSSHIEDIADNIQAVLDGRQPEYTCEYSCGSAAPQRWYRMRAVQLSSPAGGAVILLIDATQQKLAEIERERLLADEQAARSKAESAIARLEHVQAVTDAALGHLALDELLPTLTERVQRIMAVDDVSIFLTCEDGQALTLNVTRGVFAGMRVRIPFGQGVVGGIALTRAPRVIDDLSTVAVAHPVLAERLRSLAGVPLLTEGRLVGVMHVGTATPRRFDEADVQLLQLVADRIALALDRARAYEAAQAARREAEARASELAATFDAITDAVAVCDAERQVIRSNHAFRELAAAVRVPGTDLAPLPEHAPHLNITYEDGQTLPKTRMPFTRLLRGEVLRGPNTVDVRVRSADGGDWVFNVSGAPVRDADGRVRAAVVVARDMTEQQRLRRRTQEALDALVAMAEALTHPGGVEHATVLDTHRVTRRLVHTARRILGCERVMLVALEPETERLHPLASAGWAPEVEHQWRTELRQLTLRDCLPLPQMTRLLAGDDVLWDPASAGTSVQGMTIQGLSGQPYLILAPLRLDASLIGLLVLDYGTQSHGAASDRGTLQKGIADLATLVLQRDRLWREREQARANELTLQQTARRLEDFLATASHDLRAPLTASVGFTDLAIRHFQQLVNAVRETNPDLLARLGAIQNYLEEASQGGQRLGRLVNLLFDTSLMRSGKLTLRCAPFDLVQQVREEVDALGVSAPDRVVHLALPTEDRLVVVADADRIGQVITNYISNALKYSPRTQPIDLRVTCTDGYARVSVVDHGPGLPASEREYIWQPYYCAKGVAVQNGPNVGLGLGLHICKTIIERHGGQVGLESEVGQGSTFWFTLPLVAPTTESSGGKREQWRTPARIAG